MFSFRWRSPSVLMILAMLALCVSLQHEPNVSAKDKADAKKGVDLAAEADGDSSAVPEDQDGKSAKNKSKASAKKKARPEKRKKKGTSDETSESTPGTTSSGNGSGSGQLPPANGNQSGTNSRGTNSKPNSGKTSETAKKTGTSNPSGQSPPTTAGAPAAKPAAGGTAKVGGAAGAGPAARPPQGPNPALVQKVIDIQNRNQADLLKQKGVAGVGTGIDEDGNVVIKVYTTGADNPQIPKQIENVPVVEKMSGPVHPLQVLPPTPLRQTLLPRPVPIGVSAFDDTPKVCASGTLGCRLKDNHGNIYALSNNHVFANENSGIVGTDIIRQPSAGDNFCKFGASQHDLGKLAAFVPIDVTATGTNTVDCAIISTTVNLVNTSTMRDGYGVPTSKTVAAFLGQAVQKYGRTSGYTMGTVVTLNVSFAIGYNPGVANFINQIDVEPTDDFPFFGIPGDSGSLVVDMDRNPVALLFAGNFLVTDCNPIDDVLEQLATRLKLNRGVPADTVLTIDSSPATATGKDMRSTPDSP